MRTLNILLAAVLGAGVFACGSTTIDTTSHDGDGDQAEADGDAENEAEELEPGTDCAPEDAHRCLDPYTLYSCQGGVWVLAAECTEEGKQCESGECKAPEKPCDGNDRCNGDIIETCNDDGVWAFYFDCSKTGAKKCTLKECCGGMQAGCWVESDKCLCH